MRQPVPFGKYLLLDRISVGGMAEVFKAKSYGVEGFEKIIAIKRILPSMGEDRDFIKMFIDEAKIAGQLAHANICQIFELGRIEGSHFIAMEYIWGKDLLQIQNRLRKFKQMMPVPMTAYVIAKICEGLDYAHRKKDPLGRPLEIVHRDCSPQNILVSYEGEVKIIDFGIAKATSRSSRTMAGVLKGKFGYMSPEQVRGLPLDRRSDVFALGTMLYECLTGDRLFQGETDFSTLEKVRNVDIQPPRQLNPAIPEEVERVILKALAKDVDDRYQWCSDMGADLQRYLMAQDVVFTAKSLSGWLKEAFTGEIERERAQLEQYKRIGRDGLIAGVAQAEAKLDVVEHMGEAGQAEDPTVLGGPSFEDVVADASSPVGAGPAPGSPATLGVVPDKGGDGDFAEEAPTEIFGEIDEQPRAATPPPAAGRPPTAGMPSTPRPSARMPMAAQSGPAPMPVGAAPSQPQMAAMGMPMPMAHPDQMGQMAYGQYPTGTPQGNGSYPPQTYPIVGQHPYPNGPQSRTMMGVGPLQQGQPPPYGYPQQYPGYPPQQPYPQQPQYPGYPPQYQGQSYPPYAPYPGMGPQGPMGHETPGGMRMDAHGRPLKKSTLVRDIVIGIVIAAVALGAFAVVKFVILDDSAGGGDKATTNPAKAPSIVVTVDGDGPAKVFVDGVEKGSTANGTFGVEAAKGKHAVKVVRDGVPPCEQEVDVTDAGATVDCKLGATGNGSGSAGSAGSGSAGSAAGSGSGGAMVADAGSAAKPDDKVKKPDDKPDDKVKKPDDKPDDKVKKPDDKPDDKVKKPDDKPDDKVKKPDDKPDDKTKPPVATDVGYLVAYTTPFARVYVDGVDTGKSTPIVPRGRLELKPGKHKLTFEVDGQKHHYTVTIEAGKTVRFTKDLPN